MRNSFLAKKVTILHLFWFTYHSVPANIGLKSRTIFFVFSFSTKSHIFNHCCIFWRSTYFYTLTSVDLSFFKYSLQYTEHELLFSATYFHKGINKVQLTFLSFKILYATAHESLQIHCYWYFPSQRKLIKGYRNLQYTCQMQCTALLQYAPAYQFNQGSSKVYILSFFFFFFYKTSLCHIHAVTVTLSTKD